MSPFSEQEYVQPLFAFCFSVNIKTREIRFQTGRSPALPGQKGQIAVPLGHNGYGSFIVAQAGQIGQEHPAALIAHSLIHGKPVCADNADSYRRGRPAGRQGSHIERSLSLRQLFRISPRP